MLGIAIKYQARPTDVYYWFIALVAIPNPSKALAALLTRKVVFFAQVNGIRYSLSGYITFRLAEKVMISDLMESLELLIHDFAS